MAFYAKRRQTSSALDPACTAHSFRKALTQLTDKPAATVACIRNASGGLISDYLLGRYTLGIVGQIMDRHMGKTSEGHHSIMQP